MKPRFFFTLFFLILAHSAFSERYQILEIQYDLEKTRESDLKRVVPVDTDKIFESKQEFDSYLADLEQRLLNTRAFEKLAISKSSVETVPFLPDEKSTDDEIIPVSIVISATDSKHLLILPYPKYDSNDGLIFKVKVKDVNFLGTLNTMNVGVFAGIKEDSETGRQNPTFGAEFNYSYPFRLGSLSGSWNNNFDLTYTHGVNELEFWSGTGFTLEKPLRRLSLVLDFSEQANRVLEYEDFDDMLHFTSDLNFGVPVKVFEIENRGFFFWKPFLDFKVSYDKDGICSQNDDLASPVVSLGQKISAGRIDWHGNFRTGVKFEIGHSVGYDFLQNETEPRLFGEIQAFKGFKYIGFVSRFSAFLTKSNRGEVGDLIRGVRDKQKYANAENFPLKTKKALKTPGALVLNLDMPVHLITTDWISFVNKVFGEESWFARHLAWTEKFNFELQVSPFIDIALTKNEITERLFSPKDGWYTGGVEFLVFPERWRGIVMRGSVGLDLGRAVISKKFSDKIDMSWRENVKKYEIYAGIGLLY